MRTLPSLTDLEIAAFTKFARDYDVITDGEVGVRNADVLCGPIIGADSDITPQRLAASLLNVKSQIRFKSATYKAADALALKLSPDEINAYKAWAKTQKFLVSIDGSEEGYKNVESLLSWMRGNSVTAAHLDMALGNLMNNPNPGQRIHFHARPPQQDRSVVGGKPNHAFNYKEEPKPAAGILQQEFINGRRNHAYVSPDAAKKVPAQPVDAWAEIIAIQLKDWVLPNQEARLQNEYKAGVAAGRTNRDISTSLAAIIRDRQRGR
jgi:hypothetical protein